MTEPSSPPAGGPVPVRPAWAEPLAPEMPPPSPPARPRRWLPALLFVATCASTYFVGGPVYAVAVMTILVAHELGHYLVARHHGVPASLPYFLPLPLPPLGTMGAVIAMRARIANARQLFDIAVAGPIAGLVPTLVFCVVGLSRAQTTPLPEGAPVFGEPLLFSWLERWILGPIPQGQDSLIGPLGFAGWVGLLITALNLMPIGQLDGGHVLYALLRRRAHPVSTGLLLAAAGAVVVLGLWGWALMVALLFLIGSRHPPTADDHVPLGWPRRMLGWALLAFVVIGFTPRPFAVVG